MVHELNNKTGNIVTRDEIPMYISRRLTVKKNHVPDSGVDSKKA